jgi:TM2 domain-containing membrane protein YozV
MSEQQSPEQTPQPQQQAAPQPGAKPKGAEKKIVCGIMGILLGALGIHKFMLGYTNEGLIMLLVSILTCGFGAGVMGIIGLIEGIMYLTKTDEEFVNTYINNKKGWF